MNRSEYANPHHQPNDLTIRFRKAIDLLKNEPSQAKAIIEELAYERFMPAMLFVAEALSRGGLYIQDLEKAEGWYNNIIVDGNIVAYRGLGLIQLRSGNYIDAIRLFEIGAKSGDFSCIRFLARMHRYGEGFDANESKAICLLQEAANHGDFWAKRQLSEFYLKGRFGFRGIFKGVALFISSSTSIMRYILIHGDTGA